MTLYVVKIRTFRWQRIRADTPKDAREIVEEFLNDNEAVHEVVEFETGKQVG